MGSSIGASGLALSMLAVAVGAALGALARWGLAIALNDSATGMPMGTLAANLIGGYAVGLAVGWFTVHPEWPAAWRLFIITGLLGGLTTFSTFSAEVIGMLQQGRLGWASMAVFGHVAGSLAMTVAGLATVQAWRN